MIAGELVVKLKADLRNLAAGITESTRRVRGFATNVAIQMGRASLSDANGGRRFLSLGGVIASAVRRIRWYLLGAGGLSAGMLKLSMDAEETENLFVVSMGNMADAAKAWSTSFADSLRLSDTNVQKTLSTFHLMLTGMGETEEKAFDMSKAMTALTYDMASFRNLRFEDAFTKIAAGISGEVEPLRRLGIVMTENNVRNFAMRKGLIQTGQELSELQKVQLRYLFLLNQTKSDQGDLARTSDSLTNVLRTLWEQVKEVGERIGKSLQPAVRDTAKAMRDWLFENREDIARWAQIVVARITWIKDLFTAMVEVFRASPRDGFKVLLSALLETIKAAGKVAIRMAIEIGRGVWQGVKEGIFGSSYERDVAKKTREIYERMVQEAGAGDPYMRRRIQNQGRLISLAPAYETSPRFPQGYAAAQEEARKLIEDTRLQPQMDAIERIAQTAEEAIKTAGARVTNSSEALSEALKDANEKFQKTLEQIKTEQSQRMEDRAAAAQSELDAETLSIAEKMAAATQEKVDKWVQTWRDASGSIASSMETAFADITSRGAKMMQSLSAMIRAIDYEIKRSIFRNFLMPGIFQGLQSIGVPVQTPGQQAPAVRPTQYAAQGTFVPRGADTVPIMAAPGEGLAVLPQGMVNWLRDTYEGGGAPGSGGTLNINVNAIDAAGTYNFLNDNKRAIAGMMMGTNRDNHPMRRSRR